LNLDKHKWDHVWIAEPKFDGLRCIVTTDNFKASAYSRNGKPLWNMFNILAELADCKRNVQNLVFDGEVYTKDWNLSMSIVKRSTQDHPDMDKLRYHVWDCLTIKEWKAGKSSVSNLIRKERLLPLADCKTISIVQGVQVHDDAQLQLAYQNFLVEGYEGSILKNPQGIYECGRRSPNWLKIKPWSDADLTVIGAYPGEGKHNGRIGGLVLMGEVTWKDKTYSVRTEVGTGFTDDERDYFQKLNDAGKLSGKIVEIKFQDITVDGSCRFPVYNRLREDRE
jgi:ATP-dependent DNA ligase